MRHHFRHPQAMFNKGSLFYSHCGGGTVSSAGDSRWMSTGICRSNGRYLIRAPSKAEHFCQFQGACKSCSSELFFFAISGVVNQKKKLVVLWPYNTRKWQKKSKLTFQTTKKKVSMSNFCRHLGIGKSVRL
jgi:hypothetical protein